MSSSLVIQCVLSGIAQPSGGACYSRKALDFSTVLQRVRELLDEAGHRYALIGGLAMAAYGLVRTTLDLDLVVDADAQEDVIAGMETLGYETLHRSAGYSNHVHVDDRMGSVDFVYVETGTASKLFAATRQVDGPSGQPISVPSPEHLAAMKVLAMKNDPGRTFQELGDIRHLVVAAGADREEVRREFRRHGLENRYRELEATL